MTYEKWETIRLMLCVCVGRKWKVTFFTSMKKLWLCVRVGKAHKNWWIFKSICIHNQPVSNALIRKFCRHLTRSKMIKLAVNSINHINSTPSPFVVLCCYCCWIVRNSFVRSNGCGHPHRITCEFQRSKLYCHNFALLQHFYISMRIQNDATHCTICRCACASIA